MVIPINKERFFDTVRTVYGPLDQGQVDGVNYILSGFEVDSLISDPRHAAYMLATAWHETGTEMQPVRELGRGRGKRYGRPGRNGGQIPYGRGYVQLTWDANYERADRELELHGALIANYDLALDPTIAYRIMSLGMVNGWFTGKRLNDYIRGDRCDYLGARRIINGTDRAALIAGYARTFATALGIQPPATPKRTMIKRRR